MLEALVWEGILKFPSPPNAIVPSLILLHDILHKTEFKCYRSLITHSFQVEVCIIRPLLALSCYLMQMAQEGEYVISDEASETLP